MTDTPYTPGPWTAEPNGTSPREDGYNIVGPYREDLAHCPPITELIRHGNDYQTLHHGEELDARVRLIAAAPELYAALQRLADRIEQVELADGSTPDTLEARALLARIDGET